MMVDKTTVMFLLCEMCLQKVFMFSVCSNMSCISTPSIFLVSV
ncbi:hypothetical protein HanRHA438_Chr05g0208531 [Helianthus annuus]|nr:hypothetical protein HanRHA438_Chr05g0208531 [Helianthus annuus]